MNCERPREKPEVRCDFRADRAQNLGRKGSIYLVFFKIICWATNLGRLGHGEQNSGDFSFFSDDFEPFGGGKRGIKNVKCRVNCLVLSVNRERVLPWRKT